MNKERCEMYLEDIIKGLECCTSATGCNKCPYEDEENCMYQNSTDALKFLKLIAPVKPVVKNGMPFCGHCDYAITDTMNFCPVCGRMVER